MAKKVCLDPGHGGYDPGAIGPTGLKEKDVTLAVALKAGLYLQNAGIAVVLTRTSDQVPWPADTNQDLAARCKIANQAAVNLFVSIHCNSAADRNAHGTETYSLSATGEGRRAAGLIHAELVKVIKLYDRGLKTANFFVLRRTSMPAVLIELAFISNPQEEKLLRDPVFQDKAARAIAKGIAAWFGVQLQEQVPQKDDAPKLMINSVLTDVPFKIIDGHTYVQLRPFAEKLGCEVQWHEKEKVIYVLPKGGK